MSAMAQAWDSTWERLVDGGVVEALCESVLVLQQIGPEKLPPDVGHSDRVCFSSYANLPNASFSKLKSPSQCSLDVLLFAVHSLKGAPTRSRQRYVNAVKTYWADMVAAVSTYNTYSKLQQCDCLL